MRPARYAVAWHPHDENLLVFGAGRIVVHIVGEPQHSGPHTCSYKPSPGQLETDRISAQGVHEDLLFSPRNALLQI